MPQAPEKLDLKSLNLSEEKHQELIRLFPEICTEGGKIDFDRLKLVLGETVDTGKERYGMHWPGKADCFKTIQAPSMGTLRPCAEESVNFNTTGNLIIEGDNLEVLKLLQKSYLGRVKMIYIDPPYNTGNDFIYPDNYSESLQTYLEYTGQADAQGRKFGTNVDTDGRFHSKWMNMMYPRLYLARNLLREDGVIFITIDNSEDDNLRKLCNEIFGEENFITSVTWQKKVSPANDAKWFSSDHDIILIYAKRKEIWRPQRLERNETQTAYYRNPDADPRGVWNSATYTCGKSKDERPNLYYPIKNPTTDELIWPKETAVWKYAKEVTDRFISEGRLYWGTEGRARFPRIKLFLNEMDKVVPRTIWGYSEVGHTQEGTTELGNLFQADVFDSPKPSRLIRRMIEISGDPSGIYMDFFAGSGTTGQAVLEQNNLDGGDRHFVLVQLPEPTGRDDYPTIVDITKERVRRVIKKLDTEAVFTDGELIKEDVTKQDLGFRVFKLADSNFKPWDAEISHESGALVQQLELFIDHLKEGRSNQDLLFEILLKRGFPLTTPVEALSLAGHEVFGVAGNGMLVCLERDLSLDLIRAMADFTPECVVCLDEGFAGNDQLKTNAVQIFKTKGVAKFLTV